MPATKTSDVMCPSQNPWSKTVLTLNPALLAQALLSFQSGDIRKRQHLHKNCVKDRASFKPIIPCYQFLITDGRHVTMASLFQNGWLKWRFEFSFIAHTLTDDFAFVHNHCPIRTIVSFARSFVAEFDCSSNKPFFFFSFGLVRGHFLALIIFKSCGVTFHGGGRRSRISGAVRGLGWMRADHESTSTLGGFSGIFLF